jgi:hypothetical protein
MKLIEGVAKLLIARGKRGGVDEDVVRRWAKAVDREQRLSRVIARADAMALL